MKKPGSFHSWWRFDVAIVLVPLLVLVGLQAVSSSRLAKVGAIAHQTTLVQYLDAVAAEVRRVYEEAAEEMLDVPGDALAAKRFGEVAQHFRGVDASAASLLFAGSLDGCSCLTQYYDPGTGHMGIGATTALEATIVRVSMRLRQEWMQHLNRSVIYVDELDAENRVVYRFVTGPDFTPVGFAGFVVDMRQFESEYLPRAIANAEAMLTDDVLHNLIVRVTADEGLIMATHHEPGQADAVTGRFDFVFQDLELSARSRHVAAAEVLRSNALMSWILSTLMSVMAMGGVLLTWRAARRERRLSRIRQGFVANVTHELRTPLASITVFGEILRRGRVTAAEKVVEYGGRIEQESTRLSHLIDNVLSFGQIESAEARYRLEAASIEDVFGAAVAAVDTRRARSGFTISISSPPTRLPRVKVDATAMTRVFVNLLDNAMKYSVESREVRVNLRDGGDEVSVAVADSGIGIASDDRERIFDEFYRVAAGSSGVPGTGLGLAIVRHVVQAHRGRIEVSSRLDHGTTFMVVLPAVAEVPEQVGLTSPGDRTRIEIEAGALGR